MLVAVAAALALVALPGIASAHHGHDSLADAGTIQSFDPESGVLTIELAEGGSVSGLVTPRTHIHCDNGRHRGRDGLRHAATTSDRGPGGGGDDGEGEDNHRQGEEEPGDDNHANGDDPPGHDGTAPGRSEGPGRGDGHGESCGTGDLTAGKTVRFADLVLVDGKAIWSIVALPKSEEETAG
ncbi:MAG TPA: hypothetical protein VFN89_09635 [Solirubrobacterales bacterium]|nr:hypothetical protein [Solirubrobacterales bacterium]